MIKLKSLLKEAIDAKFDFPYSVGNVEFYVSSPKNNIVLLPKSRKEIEKIDTIKQKLSGNANQYRLSKAGMGNGGDTDFLSLLQIRLEKKLGISVIPNKRYEGAGYAFDIDIDELLKKL
jgi:hypothetical protein